MAYSPNTPDDVRVMLDTIGLESIDQLFDMIPPEYRLDRPLAIPDALGENRRLLPNPKYRAAHLAPRPLRGGAGPGKTLGEFAYMDAVRIASQSLRRN